MEIDPIKEAWIESGSKISWEKYLENRNKSSAESGFKDAYDEYYYNYNNSIRVAKSQK